MTTVVGVRFRHAGRIYYFNPGPFQLKKGDFVLVETARGLEYGLVATDPRLASDDDIISPLRTVLRKANDEDAAAYNENLAREKEAFAVCQEKIKEHQLEMNLIDAEYTFDGKKILFYFTADGRVDFRELVKDLATTLRARIELRQIGVRDETRMSGGFGICGRPYCCSTFLSDFAPVSIKMAKDQNLSLNPTKISGTCGRLMCCLRYEESTYEELTKHLPSEGDQVGTPDGIGEVLHVNVLRQLIKVGVAKESSDDVVITEYPLEDIKILKRSHRRRSDRGDMGETASESELLELEED